MIRWWLVHRKQKWVFPCTVERLSPFPSAVPKGERETDLQWPTQKGQLMPELHVLVSNITFCVYLLIELHLSSCTTHVTNTNMYLTSCVLSPGHYPGSQRTRVASGEGGNDVTYATCGNVVSVMCFHSFTVVQHWLSSLSKFSWSMTLVVALKWVVLHMMKKELNTVRSVRHTVHRVWKTEHWALWKSWGNIWSWKCLGF